MRYFQNSVRLFLFFFIFHIVFLISCNTDTISQDISEDSSSSQLESSDDSSSTTDALSTNSSQTHSSSISSDENQSSSTLEPSSEVFYSSESSALSSSSEPDTESSESSSSEPTPPPQWSKSGDTYTLAFNNITFVVDASYGARITSFKHGDNEALVQDAFMTGSTFWTAPQTDWAENFPPPPAIDNEPYVATLSDDHSILTLVGNSDSYLDLSVTKQFKATQDTTGIAQTYTLYNNGSDTSTTAPWIVSRCPTGGLTFFPTGEETSIVNEYMPPVIFEEIGSMSWYQYEESLNYKGFEDGSEGWVAHLQDDLLFIETFEDIDPPQFVPGDAEVELFTGDGYIEVEYQGPYTELQPGDSLVWNSDWFIATVPGEISLDKGSSDLADFARQLVQP